MQSELQLSFEFIKEFRDREAGKFSHTQPNTPIELVSDITNQLPINFTSSILVLYTIEWAVYLKFRGFTNITVTSREYDLGIATTCKLFEIKYTVLETIQDKDMKFEVVLGNPPYHTGNGESGGKHSLWRKFVQIAFDLVEQNGYVCIVCPGFPHTANDLGSHFKKNTPVFLLNDVTEHFPTVNTEVKAWIVKEGKHSLPFMVDRALWSGGKHCDPTKPQIERTILAKISKFDKFVCCQDKGYNSTQFKNDNTDYFQEPTAESIYKIRHASKIKECFVKEPTASHYKNKVMMTFSGYPDFAYYDGVTNPISSCYQMSGYIEVRDAIEGESLIAVYSSNLYTFLSRLGQSGMRGVANYSLPKVDLTRSWTDAELYAHFGLTQEEIDYVEANVK